MRGFVKLILFVFWLAYLFLCLTFMFPISFYGIFDSEAQGQIITVIFTILGLISIIVSIKKIWELKELPKKIKSDWSFLVLFAYPIIYPYFILKKYEALKAENGKLLKDN